MLRNCSRSLPSPDTLQSVYGPATEYVQKFFNAERGDGLHPHTYTISARIGIILITVQIMNIGFSIIKGALNRAL